MECSQLCLCCDSLKLSVGQEDGVVSLWDARKKSLAHKTYFGEQSDYISDMCYNPRTECLVSTCGDGTLAVYDFRKGKFMERSDDTADDDMLCCTMAKGNTKIVVGSQEGVVNLFSWGHFEDCSDRFPNGHPDSIDCMVSFSDTQVITGCGDGTLRLVSILPNRVRAEIGDIESEGNVHCMALSHDKSVLAAGADGEQLRLWCTEDLDADCRLQLGGTITSSLQGVEHCLPSSLPFIYLFSQKCTQEIMYSLASLRNRWCRVHVSVQ